MMAKDRERPMALISFIYMLELVLDLGWRGRLHCACDGLTVGERKTSDVDRRKAQVKMNVIRRTVHQRVVVGAVTLSGFVWLSSRTRATADRSGDAPGYFYLVFYATTAKCTRNTTIAMIIITDVFRAIT